MDRWISIYAAEASAPRLQVVQPVSLPFLFLLSLADCAGQRAGLRVSEFAVQTRMPWYEMRRLVGGSGAPGQKDKERTKERRLALMHHRGMGWRGTAGGWGRGPSYLSYFRPP